MLPPLNSLRAFEAAARHESFKHAADELGVTPAAVSHQVKTLEQFLGVTLFRRLPRGLELTRAAREAQPILRESFDGLAAGMARLVAERRKKSLTVSVAPQFAAMWLVPRLEAFDKAHPGIDILIDATSTLANLERDPVDVAIRYGTGEYPGCYVQRLSGDTQFPVCAPDLTRGKGALCKPEDLKRHTLLHVDPQGSGAVWPSWPMWLKAARVTDVDASKGPRFRQEHLAIRAAIDGQGVALGHDLLVADELAAGRLVRPFEVTVSAPDRFGFYFVCRRSEVERPAVYAFLEWMLTEMCGKDGSRVCMPGRPN